MTNVKIYNPHQPVILPAKFTWKSIPGWFDYQDFYNRILATLTGQPSPSIAVEVGSWFGQSTAYFAGELKRRNASHVKFTTVDTWQGTLNEAHHQAVVAQHGGSIYYVWLSNMQKCHVLDWVQPLKMQSVEAAQRFGDGTVDFLFLDGDHTTPGLVADIRAWAPKMRAGGTLSGHDADWSEVWAAVEQELPGRAKRHGRCWVIDNF